MNADMNITFCFPSLDFETLVTIVYGWLADPEKHQFVLTPELLSGEKPILLEVRTDYNWSTYYATADNTPTMPKNLVTDVSNTLISSHFWGFRDRLRYFVRTENGLTPERWMFVADFYHGLVESWNLAPEKNDWVKMITIIRLACAFRDLVGVINLITGSDVEFLADPSMIKKHPWFEIAVNGETAHKCRKFQAMETEERRRLLANTFCGMQNRIINLDDHRLPGSNYAVFSRQGRKYEIYGRMPSGSMSSLIDVLQKEKLLDFEVDEQGRNIKLVFASGVYHLEIGWIMEVLS